MEESQTDIWKRYLQCNGIPLDDYYFISENQGFYLQPDSRLLKHPDDEVVDQAEGISSDVGIQQIRQLVSKLLELLNGIL